MATVEISTAASEGDHEGRALCPSEEDAPSLLNETSAPLNFSELTPSQFGISVVSLAPLFSLTTDKSRLAQLKARRRSSVGVRGSPETNSLIRFMAQQKMKTPPTFQTPEVRYLSGCKSDENSHGGGKENNPPMTPTSSKRRRTAPPESCSVEIREASVPTLYYTLKEQEKIHICAFLWFFSIAGEDDSNGTPTMMMRKKRVRFGGPLSPEFFDKNLPPSTPLQKGGTPARGQTPGGSSQLRSVLKTPQRSESKTPERQPDLSSPTAFGASPTLAMPRKRRMPSEEEEEDGKVDKIPALSLSCDGSMMSRWIPASFQTSINLSIQTFLTLQFVVPQMTSSTTRRWNKDVDRSLYGSREYASKNPTLSPITERLSFISQSTATQQTPSVSCKETAVEDSVTSPNVSEKSAAEQDSRLSALRVRGRGLKKRKVSVADSDLLSEEPQDQTRGGREQHCEEQTTTSLELSTGIPSIHEEREVDTPSHEKQEERQGGQAAGPQKSIQSSSDSQEEEGVAHVDLAPWQADFNFEDVFKPVGTRGQRSVRRSLRNQRNAENGSSGGLVWLPHTSPDYSKETRRRTRGRRLNAALPIQPLLPEETQDASS
uniref:PP1-binding domain-containing protein n=1 Tax=Amphilophus citrinellus TaxID=61819 RepID=A0A3Q0RPQ4_AMPCI